VTVLPGTFREQLFGPARTVPMWRFDVVRVVLARHCRRLKSCNPDDSANLGVSDLHPYSI
jgi:hypothetical protein